MVIGSARDRVASFWDQAIAQFMSGAMPHHLDSDLGRWFDSFKGTGRGVVCPDASPEPYIGPLHSRYGEPRFVVLGLNPGQPDLSFQGVGGTFAAEVETWGRFSAWAVTEPYLRDPWRAAHGRNPYHENLRLFARRWLDDPRLASRDVLAMELYPWHSDAVTAPMLPAVDLIEEFIWRPIAELAIGEVMAVGAAWRRIAGKLALKEIPLGEPTFSDRTRRARSFELPSGQRLLVTWHQASNAPPNALDVASLRAAVRSPVWTAIAPADSMPAVAVASRRPEPGRSPSASPSNRYSLFWSQMDELVRRDHPAWRVGSPNRNDYPLFSPLRGSRIKCNFSRGGLRVELLLTANDRETNLRRLSVLENLLPALQHEVGAGVKLELERLEGKTQARLATYKHGSVDQQRRWAEFQRWFVETAEVIANALTRCDVAGTDWR